MKKIILITLVVSPLATVFAQEATPVSSSSPTPAISNATPATAADIEALRQQVQSLTETVKTLQQQVKDQQAAIDKNKPAVSALPENPESAPAEAASSPSGSPESVTNPPPLFPTTDTSVVAATPAVNPNATTNTAFPTTDASVTTATSPSSTTDNGSPLTQSISLVSGNKNYMNISFDAMFTLAASSARDLDHIEVGDHDPQQRGFNGRNAEIALDGAVDPYFEGFANIVLKLDDFDETEIELEEAFLGDPVYPAN